MRRMNNWMVAVVVGLALLQTGCARSKPAQVVARQAEVSLVQQATIGPSETERTVEKQPKPTPAWWADAAIDWQSMV